MGLSAAWADTGRCAMSIAANVSNENSIRIVIACLISVLSCLHVWIASTKSPTAAKYSFILMPNIVL